MLSLCRHDVVLRHMVNFTFSTLTSLVLFTTYVGLTLATFKPVFIANDFHFTKDRSNVHKF